MYYIGIDGGGTKSAFGLFDEYGNCLYQVEYPTCHFLQVGFDGCAQILKQGIENIQNHYPECFDNMMIGIGIAGYGNDQDIRHQLEIHIEKELKDYHYVLTNDMHIALIGALDGQDGIAVIAGTGSIAMAKVGLQTYRCGGWGYQLGDEGSAYWIGKQLLSEFCKQVDHRHLRDEIYEYIINDFGLKNPYEIITVIHQMNNERTEIAKLAKICGDFAEKGHPFCQDILKQAGIHISELVKGLLPYIDNEKRVTYYGGVFHNDIFKQAFCSQLSDCQLIEPIHNALVGAYMFAKLSR
ncbi:MAG: N-acetylglucosamine kinase [Longibaculum sp.]